MPRPIRRREFTAGLALLALSGGCSSSGDAGTGAGGDKIVIGMAGPLSGAQTFQGEYILNAVRIAVDEVNAKGGIQGKMVEVVSGDDGAEPRQAVIVAQKMVSTEGLLGLVGHFNSGCSIPASQIYSRGNLTMITPGSTNPKLTAQGLKNVFRVVFRDDQQGPVSGEFALKVLGAKRIAVLQDKTAYGEGLAGFFRKAVEAGGAEVIFYEGVTPGDKDFRAVLTKIRGGNPDVVFFGGYYPEAGPLLLQARQLGIKVPFLCGDGVKEQTFLQTVGTQTANIYVSGPAEVNNAAFVSTYKSRYKQAPGPFAPYSYDATRVLLAAIAASDLTRESVLAEVKKTRDFPGLAGPINFTKEGDVVDAPVQIFVIKDSNFVPYEA